MRVENARILRPDTARDALLHLDDLRAGLHQRGFEPRNFLGHVFIRDFAHGRLFVIRPMNKDGPASDARGDTDALKAPFAGRAAHSSGGAGGSGPSHPAHEMVMASVARDLVLIEFTRDERL